jgi:endonuclease YncB( thermonuclease family)
MMEGRQRTGFKGHNEQLSFDRRRKRKRLKGRLVFALVWLAAAALATAYGAGWLNLPAAASAEGVGARDAVRATFSLCFTGGGFNCVVDGDTIWFQGEKIRIADIDAPETHPPRCPSEQQLGERATLRLQQLLDAGAVSLEPIDRDRDIYGRKLRVVLVNGKSVGDTLVNEGLARWYAGGRRPWC